MKRIKNLLLALLILPALFLLGGCGEDEEVTTPTATPLTAEIVSLSYTETVFDGTEKKPTVTVVIGEYTVPNSEYEVVYSNNINAGTASVKVSAVATSTVVSGEVTKNFTISKTTAVVDNLEALKSIANSGNYTKVTVNANIEIESGDSLTIPTGVEVVLNNVTLTNNGSLYNNGVITAKVANRVQFLSAVEVANHIVLTADIEPEGADDDINIDARHRDYNFSVDLVGHKIEAELNFRTWGRQNSNNSEDPLVYFNHSINVSITSSSSQKGVIGRTDASASYYGMMINGTDDININLNNIILKGYYCGLYTNGSIAGGGSIEAYNCSFETGVDDVGAYLATNHTYRFTNCTFSSYTAYYAKSGTHYLNNCNFLGTGEHVAPKYNGSGANATGSAIVIDSCVGDYEQNLRVEINGGTISSTNGYGIEECSTAANGVELINYSTIIFTNQPTYVNCPLGNVLFNEVAKN